jgi:hypothetical protein
MQFKRARVAISVKKNSLTDYSAVDAAIHVGHARSLLLGSIISKQLETPFHVRLDGHRIKHEADASGLVVDLVACLKHLCIDFDLLYWQQQEPPLKSEIEIAIGDAADRFYNILNFHTVTPAYYQGVMCDDIITFDPSLIIRGIEFADPQNNNTDTVTGNGMLAHVQTENMLYEAAGRTKHEINLPLVTLSNSKMSKSIGNVAHWSLLKALYPQAARRFLVATALRPQDPISLFADQSQRLDLFSASDIIAEHYDWSWENFADAIEISRKGR